MSAALEAANVPRRYWGVNLGDLEGRLAEKASNDLVREAAEGMGQWFFGVNGCGKTHAMAVYADVLIRSGRFPFVQWADWGWLFTTLRSFAEYGERAAEALRVAKTASVLLIDDYGKPEDTRESVILFQIINHRNNHLLPTFFTCNTTPGVLFGPWKTTPQTDADKAIWDRFAECIRVCEVGGKSRRREARAA